MMDKTARYFDKAIKEIAKLNNPDEIKILDFGCGGGNLSQCLNELGYDVYGCDVYSTCARKPEVNLKKIRIIEKNPYHFPFDDNNFDIIVSTSVLEHAQNTEEIFQETHRVLKNNGYGLFTVPFFWQLHAEPYDYFRFTEFGIKKLFEGKVFNIIKIKPIENN